MVNELTVLNTLKSFIVANYATYKPESDDTAFTEKDIIIDSPDIDNMTGNYNIWLEPASVVLEDFTTYEDSAAFNINLCIVVKRGSSQALRERIFNIKDTIYKMIRRNQSLDDTVDTIAINSYDYYPQLYDEIGIIGMDLSLTVNYTLDLGD